MKEEKIGNSYLWVEKYKPQTVEQMILPKTLRSTLQGFVDNRNMPNLVFAGSAGVGKSSSIQAICKQLGYETMMINASLENGIDVLRNQIQGFCSSVSSVTCDDNGIKALILDEADGLTATFQPALRGFIEKFTNVRFILTCNYPNKIIEPIRSRCTVINFEIPQEEKETLLRQTLKRVFEILTLEGVTFDKKVVARLVSRTFPDMRKTLNLLQSYATNKVIDENTVSTVEITSTSYNQLITALKNKNFTEMRKWVGMNKDLAGERVFSYMFENAHTFMKDSSIPQLVLTTADYQFKNAFVADKEINITAYLTEVMAQCEFK